MGSRVEVVNADVLMKPMTHRLHDVFGWLIERIGDQERACG
jgi:hypothetical protein